MCDKQRRLSSAFEQQHVYREVYKGLQLPVQLREEVQKPQEQADGDVDVEDDSRAQMGRLADRKSVV